MVYRLTIGYMTTGYSRRVVYQDASTQNLYQLSGGNRGGDPKMPAGGHAGTGTGGGSKIIKPTPPREKDPAKVPKKGK